MGWLDTPSFVSGLNAWVVVYGVEHEEYPEAFRCVLVVVSHIQRIGCQPEQKLLYTIPLVVC